ncbi:unnamed protein product, partial [Phaeothamnion confervicola]
ISVWRPRTVEGWFRTGDVATAGPDPPAGAILVRGDPTGCAVSKPHKFRVVYTHKGTGYTVWRPMPRPGHVALGDFVCKKRAPKMVMAAAVRSAGSDGLVGYF